MFVLNSGRLVKEALDKRSAIYSSRRPPHVAQDIVSVSFLDVGFGGKLT